MTPAGLDQALAVCREGDVFAVPAIDRLARNALGTLELLKELHERGIVFSLNGTVYDPNDPMAKPFFTMLAAVAEAEGGWISIRTREAMARPSVRAKLRGRQPRLTPKQDAAVTAHYEASEMSVPEIAALFNVSRPSVYRAMERHRRTLEGTRSPSPEWPTSSTGASPNRSPGQPDLAARPANSIQPTIRMSFLFTNSSASWLPRISPLAAALVM